MEVWEFLIRDADGHETVERIELAEVAGAVVPFDLAPGQAVVDSAPAGTPGFGSSRYAELSHREDAALGG